MIEQAEALYPFLDTNIRETLFTHCFLADVNKQNITRYVPMFGLQYHAKNGEDTFAYQPIIKATNTATSAHSISFAPFIIPETLSQIEEDTQIYIYTITADFDNHGEQPIPKEQFTKTINEYLDTCITKPTILKTSFSQTGYHAYWLFEYKKKPCVFVSTYDTAANIYYTLQSVLFSNLLTTPHTDYCTALLRLATNERLSGKGNSKLVSVSPACNIENLFDPIEYTADEHTTFYVISLKYPIDKKNIFRSKTYEPTKIPKEKFEQVISLLGISTTNKRNTRLCMKDTLQGLKTLELPYVISDGHEFKDTKTNGFAQLNELFDDTKTHVGYTITAFASRQLWRPFFSAYVVFDGCKFVFKRIHKTKTVRVGGSGPLTLVSLLQDMVEGSLFSTGYYNAPLYSTVYWRNLENQEETDLHLLSPDELNVIYVKLLAACHKLDIKEPRSMAEFNTILHTIALSNPKNILLDTLDTLLYSYTTRKNDSYDPAHEIAKFWPDKPMRKQVEVYLKYLALMTLSQAIFGAPKLLQGELIGVLGEKIKQCYINPEGEVVFDDSEIYTKDIFGQLFVKHFFMFFGKSDLGKTYFKSAIMRPLKAFTWKLQGTQGKSPIGDRDWVQMTQGKFLIDVSEMSRLTSAGREDLKRSTDPQIVARLLYHEVVNIERTFILFIDSNQEDVFNEASEALLNRAFSLPTLETPLLFCTAVPNDNHPERNPSIYPQIPSLSFFPDLWAWAYDIIKRGYVCSTPHPEVSKILKERNRKAESVPEIVKDLIAHIVPITHQQAKDEPNKYIRIFATSLKGVLTEFARIRGYSPNEVSHISQNDLRLSARKLEELGITPKTKAILTDVFSQEGYLVYIANMQSDSVSFTKPPAKEELAKLLQEIERGDLK